MKKCDDTICFLAFDFSFSLATIIEVLVRTDMCSLGAHDAAVKAEHGWGFMIGVL